VALFDGDLWTEEAYLFQRINPIRSPTGGAVLCSETTRPLLELG
jgi:hypothetical protein